MCVFKLDETVPALPMPVLAYYLVCQKKIACQMQYAKKIAGCPTAFGQILQASMLFWVFWPTLLQMVKVQGAKLWRRSIFQLYAAFCMQQYILIVKKKSMQFGTQRVPFSLPPLTFSSGLWPVMSSGELPEQQQLLWKRMLIEEGVNLQSEESLPPNDGWPAWAAQPTWPNQIHWCVWTTRGKLL